MSLDQSQLFYVRGGSTTPRRASINASSNGLNTIVAASSGQQIVVLQYTIVATAAVTVTWESSGGSVIGGPMAFAANGGVSTAFNPTGHMATLSGEGLSLFLSGAQTVGGHVSYILV